jgi:arsenite methyltransferase
MAEEHNKTSAGHDTIKQCCASLYESDSARFLLGDSFHPGGLRLTERLGELLRLTPDDRVLDVASGKGTTAIFLAERFGCEVIGIDYSERNVREATEQAEARKLSSRVRFQQGDAEVLAIEDGSVDAVICECSFCTFPNKTVAATEFARALRLGGRVGIADLTREQTLPEELGGLLAWVACIADAQPVENYLAYLAASGLVVDGIERHNDVLVEMVDQIRMKLLGAELLAGLNKLSLAGVDLAAAKKMANSALAAVKAEQLGYVVIGATKARAWSGAT